MNDLVVYAFFLGCIAGSAAMAAVSRGTISMYRHWYLMVRNELERLDPKNAALTKIGARTSPREPWEKN